MRFRADLLDAAVTEQALHVGGGERMGHGGGPEWARPPRDDGGESVGNPAKLIKLFAAVLESRRKA